MVLFSEEQIKEILAKMKSASIEERLEALQKSLEIREKIFSGCSSIDEWMKAALVVEQLYAYTCELLNAKPIRIIELKETDNIQVREAAGEKALVAKSKKPAQRKSKEGRKEKETVQFQVLFEEFAKIVKGGGL